MGRIAFRDAALPAVSRTIYGVGMGSGARAILTDLANVDAGRDRVDQRRARSLRHDAGGGAGSGHVRRDGCGLHKIGAASDASSTLTATIAQPKSLR